VAGYPPVSPLAAGLSCRCPRCGRGKLFEGFLKVAPRCQVCGLDLSPHDTGDGPAVFLVFILGALVVPLAIFTEVWFAPPLWLHMTIWPIVILGLALGMLRPAKAILVAVHYKNLRHEYDET
jgi:uncharacterized protein (DUF983 family)